MFFRNRSLLIVQKLYMPFYHENGQNADIIVYYNILRCNLSFSEICYCNRPTEQLAFLVNFVTHPHSVGYHMTIWTHNFFLLVLCDLLQFKDIKCIFRIIKKSKKIKSYFMCISFPLVILPLWWGCSVEGCHFSVQKLVIFIIPEHSHRALWVLVQFVRCFIDIR